MDDTIRLVARELSIYLDEHPDAVDTADGIQRWWLSSRRIEATLEDVGQALDLLIAQGVAERRRMPDGRSVYGRALSRGGYRAAVALH